MISKQIFKKRSVPACEESIPSFSSKFKNKNKYKTVLTFLSLEALLNYYFEVITTCYN